MSVLATSAPLPSPQPRLPVIALAPNAWAGRRVNRQHILSRLAARGWPVIYSTGALSVWDRESRPWAEAGWFGGFDEVEGVLVDRPGRMFPRWQRCGPWDALAIRRHARRLLTRAGNPGLDAICYVFHPVFWPYVECLGARYVVFHAYDAYDVMPEWTPQLKAWQDRLLARADLRVATFRGIARFYPEPLRESIRELPNGVDAERFLRGPAACPRDLAAIPRPRLGYCGTITAKLDVELLLRIARARPDWHWVLLGEACLQTEPDAAWMSAWDAFRALPNVHYLGAKPFDEVAAYAFNMDVNTICYRTGDAGWWAFGSPNKLHESLALGKPLVATPLETIRPFAHVVHLARTAEEWIAAIRHALEAGGTGTPQQRRAVARQNTWERRVDILERWLFEMCAPAP